MHGVAINVALIRQPLSTLGARPAEYVLIRHRRAAGPEVRKSFNSVPVCVDGSSFPRSRAGVKRHLCRTPAGSVRFLESVRRPDSATAGGGCPRCRSSKAAGRHASALGGRVRGSRSGVRAGSGGVASRSGRAPIRYVRPGGGGAGEDGVDDEVGVGGIQRAAGQEQAVVEGAQDHLEDGVHVQGFR